MTLLQVCQIANRLIQIPLDCISTRDCGVALTTHSGQIGSPDMHLRR
ncbi:hypothetical protein Pcac1_g3666 [Phytophthora cactorum]|nr:hypothetical protein Pcac1_g3666 [Phytophthora cactorum]KAG3070658.1 hypothetical protein PC121_g9434 [Phytophthora cactorum]